jgi:hypothetical protein
MYIKLIVIFSFFFTCSFSAKSIDCLNVAINQSNKDLNSFYNYIEAVYIQENTNQPKWQKDLYSFLYDKTQNIFNYQDTSEEDTGTLKDLVEGFFPMEPGKRNLGYWVKYIQDTQEELAKAGLQTPEAIQKIHDAAIYGGPALCPNGQLMGTNEIFSKIKDSEQLESTLEKDERYLLVKDFRKTFSNKSDNALKIGAEIELFSSIYFDLFSDFVSDENLDLWASSIDQENLDKNALVNEINNKINSLYPTEKQIFVSIDSIFDPTLSNLGKKLDRDKLSEFLPDSFKWLVLANYLREKQHETVKHLRESNYKFRTLDWQAPVLKAQEFFANAPMYFKNFMIVDDPSNFQINDPSIKEFYYGLQVPKVELVHKRPYKNAAAYLESIVLLTNKNKKLMGELLLPTKQLGNKYTHHVHISYQPKDFVDSGARLQDTIALTLLKDNENTFTTDNKFIKYKQNIRPNKKHLIRIAPEDDITRLEFRRQFSGWKYEDFLAWLISNVLIPGPLESIDAIKKLNNQLLQQVDQTNVDKETGRNLMYIKYKNEMQ